MADQGYKPAEPERLDLIQSRHWRCECSSDINSSHWRSYSYVEPLTGNSSPGTVYGYDPDNRRVYLSGWTWNAGTGLWVQGSEQVSYYGIGGQKLGSYSLTIGTPQQGYTCCYSMSLTAGGFNVYFGSKLVRNGTGVVKPDRLGSVGKFYPYGEDRGAGANDTEKFATYYRDQDTGLDYAMNRYYNSTSGRFLTADRYTSRSGSSDPGAWNRYSYVVGDPIGFTDRNGTNQAPPEDDEPACGSDFCVTHTEPGGGGGSEEPWIDPPSEPTVEPPDPGNPGAPLDPPTLPSCRDLLSGILSKFLTDHKFALSSKDPKFVTEILDQAARVGIDPRLFAAETLESTYGSSKVAQTMNNPFGLMSRGRNSRYTSIGLSVIAEADTLQKLVYTYGENLSQMYSGLPGVTDSKGWNWVRPPAYCGHPGCAAFGKEIESALKSMGGDPNNLKYPTGQVGGADCK